MSRIRKWSRFRISEDRKLRARILQGLERSSALNSIGIGGCSFFTSRKDAQLLQRPEVKVEVTLAGESMVLDGVVHYCKFLPQKATNIVGIEFKWPNEEIRRQFGSLIGKAVVEGNLEHDHQLEV